MRVYLGVDCHARTQTVCWCDTGTGEYGQARLDHRQDDLRGFYAQFAAPAVVGLEASGYSEWFQRGLEEWGHEVWLGDAYAIPQAARRRQKNDRRDAALILELLLRGEFPRVHRPSTESREVLRLLRFRQRLVRLRTSWKNSLQALALDGTQALLRQHALEWRTQLDQQIAAVEKLLTQHAQGDERVARLRTHPGVGLLTALAVVHTLEPADRFTRARQVAAYCGLDPQERSSGDRQRYGSISKQGNRLLRHLLVEAAHTASRHDPDLRRFYFHLLGRRNSAVAVVAVARQLALRLFRLLRDRIDYEQFRTRGRDARCARRQT